MCRRWLAAEMQDAMLAVSAEGNNELRLDLSTLFDDEESSPRNTTGILQPADSSRRSSPASHLHSPGSDPSSPPIIGCNNCHRWPAVMVFSFLAACRCLNSLLYWLLSDVANKLLSPERRVDASVAYSQYFDVRGCLKSERWGGVFPPYQGNDLGRGLRHRNFPNFLCENEVLWFILALF